MKEKYNSPEMEIILFECEDVITSSGGGEPVAYAANEVRFLPLAYIDSIDDTQWN
ncbi:MAG: hypothetical protein IJ006_02230 [Lachnospiraceae bacterium]|nr:hypothetical protein [Lachnospiraceae bacterium]MBQ8845940.1 hypothetical protein [Lachnospiraceae bacterium]